MSTQNLGRIKWFNNRKGFGFLTDCETNDDIFVKSCKNCTGTLRNSALEESLSGDAATKKSTSLILITLYSVHRDQNVLL